jgi:hypothetical protein
MFKHTPQRFQERDENVISSRVRRNLFRQLTVEGAIRASHRIIFRPSETCEAR